MYIPRRNETQAKEGPEGEKSLLTLVRKKGILRSRDLRKAGIPRVYLTRLIRRGRLVRISRGLYTLADADPSPHHSFAQVAKRVPHGVICLLSALSFHDLTTQSPHEVWLAIAEKARKPKLTEPALRVFRFSPNALRVGVSEHSIDGVSVKITSRARTVADCFKYRNKIGLDVALEALRDFRKRRHSMDDLWRAAQVSRVSAVMRPYLEAMV